MAVKAEEASIVKKIGEYTAKGMVAASDTEAHKLQLFDGRFDTGYRVTGFQISISDRDNDTLVRISGKLMTEPGASNRNWDWSKNTEIAWAVSSADANSHNATGRFEVVDPDNMIVEDLYIGIIMNGNQTANVNYMITFDKYDITDWQGALTMVRNKSQA